MGYVDSAHGAAVGAEGFGLKGPRGWVFRRVDFDAPPGALVAIEGPSGTGRTCLLLALTGRMRATEGGAAVAGLPLPRRMAAVRQVCALGPVPGVNDLDPALTVAEHLRERVLLRRRFDGSLRSLLRPRAERSAAARELEERALEAAGLDLATLPKGPRTAVRDLERLEGFRLSVALAMIGRPRVLAVDDMDHKLSDADRDTAWSVLRSVAAGGTTVLAVCAQAPEDALVVRTAAQEPEKEPSRAAGTRAPVRGADAAGGSAPATGRGVVAATGPATDSGTAAGTGTATAAGTATATGTDAATATGPAADSGTAAGTGTAPASTGTDAVPGYDTPPDTHTDTHTAPRTESATDTEEEPADAIAETGRA